MTINAGMNVFERRWLHMKDVMVENIKIGNKATKMACAEILALIDDIEKQIK